MPGPAFDLLIGGSGYYPGLDSTGAALCWRSELSRAEGLALAANRQVVFAREMLTEALGRCFVAPPNGGESNHVRFTGHSPSERNKGEGSG